MIGLSVIGRHFSGCHVLCEYIKTVLGEYMSCGRTFFSGDMSFRMTCITRTFVLREVMLFFFRTILLWEDMSCRSACLQDGISFRMMGGQVLLEGTSYRRSCLTGVHVLQEYMFYRSICFTGVYVLQDGIFYRMICPTGRHVIQEDRSYWCVGFLGDHALLKSMPYRWT